MFIYLFYYFFYSNNFYLHIIYNQIYAFCVAIKNYANKLQTQLICTVFLAAAFRILHFVTPAAFCSRRYKNFYFYRISFRPLEQKPFVKITNIFGAKIDPCGIQLVTLSHQDTALFLNKIFRILCEILEESINDQLEKKNILILIMKFKLPTFNQLRKNKIEFYNKAFVALLLIFYVFHQTVILWQNIF
ncbi:hypothetical protein BpHYR1_023397 [Brachionus plicatilis]|uniref:Transmembrane protein n=1 Tax=Brachionus plicatilis TaxID=10195 RepID=A0A3M7QCE8_BRAPC|nr:hypothetical protein BpHYR1_023397 [Brachionus plicatilis]